MFFYLELSSSQVIVKSLSIESSSVWFPRCLPWKVIPTQYYSVDIGQFGSDGHDLDGG